MGLPARPRCRLDQGQGRHRCSHVRTARPRDALVRARRRRLGAIPSPAVATQRTRCPPDRAAGRRRPPRAQLVRDTPSAGLSSTSRSASPVGRCRSRSPSPVATRWVSACCSADRRAAAQTSSSTRHRAISAGRPPVELRRRNREPEAASGVGPEPRRARGVRRSSSTDWRCARAAPRGGAADLRGSYRARWCRCR